MSDYPRGSEWRKWDLHVHTPESIMQYFSAGSEEATWKKYITSLEALDANIKVIGVNDYFFIDGYKRLKEEKQAGRLQNIDLLLPVVEFRIKIFAGVNFKDTKRINFHVIFDDGDKDWVNTIQSQFLNGLHQHYYKEDGTKWTRIIDRQSVEDFGKEIKSGIPIEKLGDYGSDLVEGFNNLNVDEEEIIKLLESNGFKGRYLTAVGKTEWEALAWSDQSIATKKSIINKADIVFTAAESPDTYKAARKKLKEQHVNTKLLDCSDAHYYSDHTDNKGVLVKDRLGNCSTWIKADTTFEGLKQIIYEFDERVRVQEKSPYDDVSKYVLDSFKVESSSLVKKREIIFNRDLIGVIGGKGSGKSFLLKAVSAMSDHYVPHEALDGNPTTSSYNFVDKDDDVVTYSDVVISQGANNNEPILYIEQEELAHASKQKGKVREAYLKELGIYDDSTGYQHISDASSRLLGQIVDKLDSMLILEEKTGFDDDKRKNQTFEAYLQAKIKNLKDTIEKTSSKETKEMISSVSQLIREGRNLKLWIEDSGFTQIDNDLEALNEKVEAFNERLTVIGMRHQLTKLDVGKLRAEKKLIEAAIQTAYKQKQTEYQQKREELKQHDITEDIPVLLKTLEGIQNQLALYEDAEKSLKDGLEEIEAKKKEATAFFHLRNGEVVKAINERVDDIDMKYKLFCSHRVGSDIFDQLFSGLSVKAEVFFDSKKLIKDLQSCFYNGRADDLSVTIFKNKEHTYQNYLEWVNAELWIFYDSAIKKNDLMTRLSGHSVDGKERLKEIVFLKWYEYIMVSTAIRHDFDGTVKEIATMSTGELATVLLKLKLVTEGLDKQIIILDQPEDHLDNSFIANGLVDLLKTLKKSRQIIVATHNANIIVGTDAEQVIVAHGLDQPYTSGSIENGEIQENIIQILEGGREAFDKRFMRYKK